MLTFLSIISWTVYVNSSNYVMIMMNSVEKIDNSLWPLVSFSPSYCISPAPRPLFLTECVSPLSFHHHLPHRVGKAISNIQAAHMYTYYTYKTHTHYLLNSFLFLRSSVYLLGIQRIRSPRTWAENLIMKNWTEELWWVKQDQSWPSCQTETQIFPWNNIQIQRWVQQCENIIRGSTPSNELNESIFVPWK